MRHRALSFFGGVIWTSCGLRPDKDHVIALKSAIVDCPVCLKTQNEERAKAKERLREMLANPRKGPLRKPSSRTTTRAYEKLLVPGGRRTTN